MSKIKYLSICSGIESVGVAWNPLGFEPVGLSEIDPFRSAVLEYHYPEVKNYGDFTKIQKTDLRAQPDVLVGGTPCATFSIAGLRKGINTERGNLALEFIKLAQRLQPTWVVWENVCGVLSSNGGRDFASFLGGLAECRYGFAYRVLNTEYVRTQRFPRAIPQRRRRVFVIGHIRDWRSAGKVLFDSSSMPENPKPSRRKRSKNTQNPETDFAKSDTKRYWKKIDTESLYKIDEDVSWAQTAHDRYTVIETSTPDKSPRIYKDEISPTLTAMTGGNRQPIVFAEDTQSEGKNNIIRRITPIEAERLQGFPDNYTQIPYRGKPKEECPVSKRYEACGRAMSINVMEYIGDRLKKVHNGEI